MEELPLDMSRLLRGGNEVVPGVVPRAGGGEGLYIAPRHTRLLYNTVDDASKPLYRGTVSTTDTVPGYILHHRHGRVPSNCNSDKTGATTSCRFDPCSHYLLRSLAGMEDTPNRYLAILPHPVADGGGKRKPLTSAPRHGYAEVVRAAGPRGSRVSHCVTAPA